jgi:hypothetical protein
VSPHNSQTLFSIHFYLALCVMNAGRCHVTHALPAVILVGVK